MDLGLRAPTHGRPAIHVHLDSPTTESTPRIERERGSAVAMAVIVVVLLGMIGAAIVASSQRERAANRTRSDRMVGQGPVDIALSQYRFGLQSGNITPLNRWAPGEEDLKKILTNFAGLTGRPIPNARLATYQKVDDASVPEGSRFTAEIDGAAGGRNQYWQIFKVDPPTVVNGQQLIVTFRAWVADSGTSSNVTSARIVRASFRQGRFSDYQLLTNGPIRLETGVTIRGPIHSNGATDPRLSPPRATDRIFADAGATVVCPTADADVSTAMGTINLPGACSRYNSALPDENFISFQGLTKSFRDMSGLCNGQPVHCFLNAANKGPYTVVMHTNGQTEVFDQGANARTWHTNVPNGGYIFNNSISIRGVASQRMSIAAFANGRTDIAAPSITIVNNVAPATGMSLGLFAQGDVVVNPYDRYAADSAVNACTSRINAVLIAQTGSLSLGRQNMSPIAPSNPPAPCGPITIRGAIASTTSPVLSYRWPNRPGMLGFTERVYEWDPLFRDNPPPFTPGTDRWDVSTVADADQSALAASVNPAP